MGVIEYTYDYQKPESTYTLDQFIACQSDISFCYNNLSFIDKNNQICHIFKKRIHLAMRRRRRFILVKSTDDRVQIKEYR